MTLPAELKVGRRYPGYWRIENGVVPVQATSVKGDTVVVLTGNNGGAPAAKTVTIEISGLLATPATVVVGEGSVVEFKNGDKVPHDLSTPAQDGVMSLERLAPGNVRRQRFMTAGGYQVRCAEHPHIVISLIVVGSPHFGFVDEKGGFKIGDVPDGKATLKVWSQGRWVHSQDIEVTAKGGDMAIKVAGSGAREAAKDGE